MKKQETLRGRGTFSRLFASGRRLDGTLVRCFFLLERKEPVALLAGFSVSSRTYNAVRRNRLRRLMREAFTLERPVLWSAVQRGGCSLSIVFVFKGTRGLEMERLSLHPVRSDIASLCATLATAL